MHIITLFATEVVLLRKLGENEVTPSKKNLISKGTFQIVALVMTNKQDITVNKVVVPLGYARGRLCGT
jgi:hypothetical protein